jgi:hypothetical protein
VALVARALIGDFSGIFADNRRLFGEHRRLGHATRMQHAKKRPLISMAYREPMNIRNLQAKRKEKNDDKLTPKRRECGKHT